MSKRLSTVTRGLVVASTLVIGPLAGSAIDRTIIGAPAWQQLGAQAWADYSRHADLGRGLVLYPLEGIGATVLALAAAVTFTVSGRTPRAAAPPIYVAALCMLSALVITRKAAPIMLGVPKPGNNERALTNAFDQFRFWGMEVRGTFLVLAFLASVWAGVAVFRTRSADLLANLTSSGG
jgi:hypothetical protein